MTSHKTGTREEWLAARLELLEAEKELTRRGDELSRRRQELPWVRVGKDSRPGRPVGDVPVAGPGTTGTKRDAYPRRPPQLVPPPRRVRQRVTADSGRHL
jgi:Bacterial protein of unknown function (DUF899)